MSFSPYLNIGPGEGGETSKEPLHNLLVKVFTLGSSKDDVVQSYGFVRHVLGRIYVFVTLFGYWVRAGGGRGLPRAGTQLAYANFHLGQREERSFRKLFF